MHNIIQPRTTRNLRHLAIDPSQKYNRVKSNSNISLAVSTTEKCQNSHLLDSIYAYYNTLSLISKWDYKVPHSQKKGCIWWESVNAAAWEQVSHNDVTLTDVGQLFISLPRSVPTGAQTHMLPSMGQENILARFCISVKKKSGSEVTAAKCVATCTWNKDSHASMLQRQQ